ncbi:unnamed protein product [Prorocentrum cordatum]|uniref:Uncharacterized protein n=1 Tax=Prorocentrum cordatum TaxID=2364126 RepID=A0ABN9Y775_9DINO|nr:unnamed protein product [Polarella glacialis]
MLYLLRHSGASRDFANQLRPLSEVKRRGRWMSEASVRRYEKGGRLAEQFSKLPPDLEKHALRCHRALPEVLLGGRAAPPFQARSRRGCSWRYSPGQGASAARWRVAAITCWLGTRSTAPTSTCGSHGSAN